MTSSKTALILIEFQNDFCSRNGKLNDLVRDEIARNRVIENAERLLWGARAKGIKIIHCPFVLDKTWAVENKVEGLIKGLVDDDVFLPNSWGAEIIEQLTPLENESIVSGKRALNGFVHTNLGEILANSQIENVGIAGFLTNVCVQATAWGAYDRGYSVRIIPEACGAATQSIQEFVEKEICPIFGGVPSVDDFLNDLT